MEQLCLACNENPATSMSGTVPLCSECAALVTDHRGVKFRGPESEEENVGVVPSDAAG